MRLFTLCIALIPWRKVWAQLFPLQQLVNCKKNWRLEKEKSELNSVTFCLTTGLASPSVHDAEARKIPSSTFLLFLLLVSFSSMLADGLSLEAERQQVSLDLQECSENYDQSQQCCRLRVLICPLISNSSNSFSKTLGTVPNAPITTDTTVTLMFHSYLSSQARSNYFLPLFSLSLLFSLWSVGTARSIIRQILFFFFSLFFCVRYH